jgi:hypothetical protein
MLQLESKRLRNDSAKVSRLPAEIFGEIASLVAELDPPTVRIERVIPYQLHTQCEGPATLGWLKMGHVCYSWRGRILAMQSLWAGSIGSIPLALDEMLVRAGPCALINLHLRDDLDVFRLLERDSGAIAARISSIVTDHPIHNIGFAASLADRVADLPKFDTLHLTACSTEVVVFNSPSLRHLCIGWALAKCSSLVSLKISPIYNTGRGRPSLEVFIELLRSSSKTLQKLKIALSRCFGPTKRFVGHVPYHAGPKLTLPSLRTLAVEDHMEDIIKFMASLSIPKTASVALFTTSSSAPLGIAAPLLRCASDMVRDASAIYISFDHVADPKSQSSYESLLWFRFYSHVSNDTSVWTLSAAPAVTVRVAVVCHQPHPSPFFFSSMAESVCDGLPPVSPPALAIDLFEAPPRDFAQHLMHIINDFPPTRRLLLFNSQSPCRDLMKELLSSDGLPSLEYICLAGKGDRKNSRISSALLRQQVVALKKNVPKLAPLRVESSLFPIEEDTDVEEDVEALRKVIPVLEWRVQLEV